MTMAARAIDQSGGRGNANREPALLLVAGTAGFFFGFFVSEFLPPGPAQLANAVLGILAPAGLAWCGAALWLRGQD